MKSTRLAAVCDTLVLTVCAAAMRLLYHLTYAPGWCLDSEDYGWRFLTLWNRTWQVYDGYKPPGYCLFLGIAQWLGGVQPTARLSYPGAAMAANLQQLAGLSATLMVYFILRNINVGRWTAFFGALFLGTLASVCLFEILILSLSLTSFFLITGLWLCSWSLRRALMGRHYWFLALGSGVSFSLATWTRSEIFIFLLAFTLTGIAISFVYRGAELITLRSVLLTVLCSGLPLIVALIAFNGIVLGQLTLTTAAPYAATSTVYNIFDRVSKRDRVFGEIMMKYYKGPARIDLVNDAWGELSAHAAEMPVKHRGPWTQNSDLMAYAGEVAHRLQRRYPLVFLSNAMKSFGRTFDFNQGRGFAQAPTNDPIAPDGTDVLKWRAGARIVETIRFLQPLPMLALYCMTVLLIPAGVLRLTNRASAPTLKLVFAFAMAVATVATLAAFGFAHAYFSHYGIVYFGTIVICGVVFIDALMDWQARRGKAEVSL